MEKVSDATVEIYDDLGRLVKNKYNQKMYNGDNIIELDFSNYKAGIYFVSLSINNETLVKQIVKK